MANFSPEYIHSKKCFGCSRQIFWQNFKHYYSDGAQSDSPKHECEGSRPKTSRSNDISTQLEKHESMLTELLLKVNSIICDNEEKYKDWKRRVWELSEEVKQLRTHFGDNK